VRWKSLRGVLLLPLSLSPVLAQEADPIAMYYDYRPPLITVDDSPQPGGILVEPLIKILARARIRVKWVRNPSKRGPAVMKSSTGNDCTFGWYKTAEREGFAVFSLPYYLDKPPAGLARADFNSVGWANAAELLKRRDLRVTLRLGVAYGDYLDELLDKMPAEQLTRVDTDSVPIARMIHFGHTDLTILPIEEVSQVIGAAGLKPSDFRILFFSDLPHQDYRYVVCSKATDPKVMAKINQAIKELGLP